MGYHVNHAISQNQNGFIFKDGKFVHLSGLIETFVINKKCFEGFNVGPITPWGTSLSKGFALIF